MRKIIFVFGFILLTCFVWSETVYDIQYTTDPDGASPLEGQTVTVTGIVTATNWYVSGYDTRFFISDPEGGEWHGVFVFNYDYEVDIGDEVELTAEVQEYYGFTELSNLTELTILSSGNTVPDPVTVTTNELSGSEALESVLVQVNDVSVTQGPNNYGEAYIDDGSGECQTDDAMYNYEPIVGNEYSYIIGIVDYSYDEYGLNPRFASDIGFSGEPGYVEGTVTLDGGSGNLEDVVISTDNYSTNPDDSGEYELELPPGTYDITASLTGYSSQTVPDVIVEEDETTSGINFTLSEQTELTIYDIQYTEDPSGDSPYDGQIVTVSGYVTGSGFANNNYFFISSAEGGAWNGIYVYQYDEVVEQGDHVTVTGEVSEYYGFTEIGYLDELIINSSGNPLPAPVDVTTAELATEEAYESVLVRINDVVVSALPNDYNEWYVDDGSGECQVDDGFGAIYPNLNVGDSFVSITGLVDYYFEEYGLHPRDMDDFDTGGGPVITSIYDIQYTEDPSGDSPYVGQIVTVEALVTGSGFSSGLGYFLTQEGGAWNGIYVFDDENTPDRGDLVTFSAEVAEYFGFTELINVSGFQVLSSGNALPTYPSISTNELANEEAYEGVYVAIHDVTVTQLPNDYGEWFVDDGSGECQIDDGFGVVFPELGIGDEINYIYGLVDYSYSEFGLHPQFDYEINYGQDNDENIISISDFTVYPNPFRIGNQRSSLNFCFTLDQRSDVKLAIYNIKGQKLIELEDDRYEPGNYQLNWNGKDLHKKSVPVGVYLYRFSAGDKCKSDKILLIK